jgi:transcriptional regulator with XRE-family HTH domain
MGEAHDPLLIPARLIDGDFAGWLSDAMTARGMSQRMLAALTGIDHSTVSRLLGGDRQPALATALALIRVLERPRLQIASPVVFDAVDLGGRGAAEG